MLLPDAIAKPEQRCKKVGIAIDRQKDFLTDDWEPVVKMPCGTEERHLFLSDISSIE
jgi:hypothetical protein